MDSIEFKRKYKALNDEFDSFQQALMKEVLSFVKANPHSYFSGFLLYHYQRMLPRDTMTTYFTYLDKEVMSSAFGKQALTELLKSTDDWVFKKRFIDSATYVRLKDIKTIFDVSLSNLKETKTSFSDFRGNIILIDFWGRGCAPCIRNIPYLKQLISDMKGKPVRFVSVSIDVNKDIWKKTVKEYGVPGLQLFDDNGLLSTFYKVLWVPWYIIIAPDGTVARINAPQASDPDLKALLNTMLKM
jgi:thiol-disulfide isomerase/thioredoxin